MLQGENKKHEELYYGENIENLKSTFIHENETYNAHLATKIEKFTEKDTIEFKNFLLSFLQENRKVIDDFLIKKYESKSKTFDIHV